MLDRFVDLPFSVALESVENCRHFVLLVRCEIEIIDHFRHTRDMTPVRRTASSVAARPNRTGEKTFPSSFP